MHGRPFALTVAIGLSIALAIGLDGCAPSAGATTPNRITVASERCGAGWADPHAGQQSFLLANTDIVTGEVYLVDAESNAVYAYVDNLAPGATATLRVDLGSGDYAFRCAMADEGVAYGARVHIAGSVAGGPAPVRAVTDNDLVPVAKQYDAWLSDQLPGLQGLVGRLLADIRDGRLAAARTDWLPAHLAYERLGAAYGAFGAADVAINGLAAGLPLGTADPGFSGFHRIEFGLWHGQAAAELAPIASKLAADVSTLAGALAATSVATLDLAIRSHEIAENALQFDLTGESDYGSGSSLASVDAELDGTGELLTLMTPVLQPRYPQLGAAERALALAKSDVAAESVDGRWTPLSRLDRASRERIDSDLGGLASLLAPVASIAEPRIDS